MSENEDSQAEMKSSAHLSTNLSDIFSAEFSIPDLFVKGCANIFQGTAESEPTCVSERSFYDEGHSALWLAEDELIKVLISQDFFVTYILRQIFRLDKGEVMETEERKLYHLCSCIGFLVK
jgi:hypothetical protein